MNSRSRLARRILALLASAFVGVLAVASVPAPAQAEPLPDWVVMQPGEGWTARWVFVDDHKWHYFIYMPWGSVQGTGIDGDGYRYFEGTLKDYSPEPDRCAYLKFEESTGYKNYVACDGNVRFNHLDVDKPGTYDFTLSIRREDNRWQATSYLTVPTSENYSQLRALGNHGQWKGNSEGNVTFELVRPGAAIYGTAIGHESRIASLNVYPTTCTSTTISDFMVPTAKAKICPAQSGAGLTSANVSGKFKVTSCLQADVGTVDDVMRCLPLVVT